MQCAVRHSERTAQSCWGPSADLMRVWIRITIVQPRSKHNSKSPGNIVVTGEKNAGLCGELAGALLLPLKT